MDLLAGSVPLDSQTQEWDPFEAWLGGEAIMTPNGGIAYMRIPGSCQYWCALGGQGWKLITGVSLESDRSQLWGWWMRNHRGRVWVKAHTPVQGVPAAPLSP